MGKTALFSRKVAGGVYIITDETVTTGDRWFVDSGSATGADSAGAGTSPDMPFLTWDYAVGVAAANNGDTIYLMPGHAESIAAAGGVALDKAGVRTIGIGEGADRPTFTFITSNNASITLSAASNTIKNILLIGNKDGLVAPLAITGSDFDVDVEYRDTSSAIEAKKAITVSGGAARGKIKLKHIGFTAGDNQTQSITVQNGANIDIDVDYYGEASTAVVDMVTTASTNINVTGYFYNDNGALTKNVVDTVTGSTWSVKGYDGKGGYGFSGGSAATPAADDVSTVAGYNTVATANTSTNAVMRDVIGNKADTSYTTASSTKSIMAYSKAVLGFHTVATANTSTNARMRDTVGNKTDTAVGAVTTTKSIMAYVKGILNNSLEVNAARGNYFTVTADMTSATWATKTTHEIAAVSGVCRVRIVPFCATSLDSSAACLIKLGTSASTTAFIGATTATGIDANTLWVTSDTASKSFYNYSSIFDKVAVKNDIGYEITGKTASGGSLVFHIYWEPLTANSTVTAGAGGSLA